MPAIPLVPHLFSRDGNSSDLNSGMALPSIIGLAIAIVVVFSLVAVAYLAVRKYYHRKAKASRRAQEDSGAMRGLVRALDAPNAPNASTRPYHYIQRRTQNRESSGTMPLLSDVARQSWGRAHEQDHLQEYDVVEDGVEDDDDARNINEISLNSNVRIYKGNYPPAADITSPINSAIPQTSAPDRIFFGLSTPISSSGSTFTFAGAREALAAVPTLRSSSPPSAIPLSAATASTGPFSAFIGTGPLSAVTASSDSTFAALDRFPNPPPVPDLPSRYIGSGNSHKRKQDDEEGDNGDDHLERSNTTVIGHMLKTRAKKAKDRLSRSFSGASIIERADSIKSVKSPLTPTKRSRSRRRLTSLKIPYFITPASIQNVSPSNLDDVTPPHPNNTPPSQTTVPTIAGPRPLRKNSKMPIIPLETLTEDPGSSHSNSSFTDSSGLTSVPVLFSSTSIPGFTALMPRPEAKWPVTPATSLAHSDEPSFLPESDKSDSLASPILPLPLTTAFRESIPLSAATPIAPWGLPASSSNSTDSHISSHPPSSFHFTCVSIPPPPLASVPAARLAHPDETGSVGAWKTTAPLSIPPSKRSRSNSRSSNSSEIGDARNTAGGIPNGDGRMSDNSGRMKLQIQTQLESLVLPKSQPRSQPPSRPPSRERPTGRVIGARMRGASSSSLDSNGADSSFVPGPKAQVYDVTHIRQVPGADAMLGRYHRVRSMQGVVVNGQ